MRRKLTSLFSVAVVVSTSTTFLVHAESQPLVPAADTSATHATISDSVRGQLLAESHRSTVASLVDALTVVASREAGIADQLRALAQAEKESAVIATEAIEKAATRGAVAHFLLGNDRENIDLLKTTVAAMKEHRATLQAIAPRTKSESDGAILSTQIQMLASDEASIWSFITAHEN